jgi:hypothetical protein
MVMGAAAAAVSSAIRRALAARSISRHFHATVPLPLRRDGGRLLCTHRR